MHCSGHEWINTGANIIEQLYAHEAQAQCPFALIFNSTFHLKGRFAETISAHCCMMQAHGASTTSFIYRSFDIAHSGLLLSAVGYGNRLPESCCKIGAR
jgi:hypothetical protein